MLRSAVERQFEIIGDALSQLLKLEPALESKFTHCRRIIGFRNVLIHNYWSISHDIVWGILESDLPILKLEVASLLKTAGP